MSFSLNIQPKNQYVKLQTSFDMLSTIFRLVIFLALYSAHTIYNLTLSCMLCTA